MTSSSAASPGAGAPQSTVLLLGGGYDDPLLALLASLLSDSHAPIEILTTATTEEPERTHRAYARVLHRLGCPHVGHLQVDEEHSADAPATLARLEAAALLFITGGDQERLTEQLLDTEFLAVLRRRHLHDAGFVLAGTSAGASALGAQMLVRGRGWRSWLAGHIDVIPGLGLLPGCLIDQHFIERDRYPRLMHAVLAHPRLLGLGLSEETGLLLRPGHPAEVFGDEVVLVVDGRRLRHNRFATTPANQPVGGQGFEVSVLVRGDRVDVLR